MYEEDIKKCKELIELINERQKQHLPTVEKMLNDYKLQLTKKRLVTLERKQKEEENDGEKEI
jgi:hypothetical protein